MEGDPGFGEQRVPRDAGARAFPAKIIIVSSRMLAKDGGGSGPKKKNTKTATRRGKQVNEPACAGILGSWEPVQLVWLGLFSVCFEDPRPSRRNLWHEFPGNDRNFISLRAMLAGQPAEIKFNSIPPVSDCLGPPGPWPKKKH